MKTFARYIGFNGNKGLANGEIYLLHITSLADGEYLTPLNVTIGDVYSDTHPDYKDFNKYWEII